MSTKSWLATATPPTPNGDLHLGHLSGPYLAADVVARHLRRCGAPTMTLTGIDDHQSYTERAAIGAGESAEQTATWFGDRIVQAWEATDVHYDVIGRPRNDQSHRQLTQDVFRVLFERGHIVARTRPLPFCRECQRWAFEAYVTGGCPHCGSPSCGNACEVCGRPNDCADLLNPSCTMCGTPCEVRDCERLYLPLAPHLPLLQSFWSQVLMNGHLSALCKAMAADGLPEIAVSHPADWGIPTPVAGFTNQRIYVWFEMAAGYLAAGAGAWGRCDRVAQCFGFDNGWFHAVLFPVVMRLWDEQTTLPAAFICNEFLRLDGLKFSTSRRHAVWVLDALRDAHPDHLRLYLAWERPAVTATNFTWDAMRARIGGDLLPRWSRWLFDLARRCELRALDWSPTAAGAATTLGAASKGRVARLRRATGDTARAVNLGYGVEQFDLPGILQALHALVRLAADTGEDLEHLAGAPGLHETFTAGVDAELAAAALFAAGLAPITPKLAEALWAALGLPDSADDIRWTDDGPEGVAIRAARLSTAAVEQLVATPGWHPPVTAQVATR